MRNRVAIEVARGTRATLRRLVRVSVVLAMVPAALALAVSTASASTADGVAANTMPFRIGARWASRLWSSGSAAWSRVSCGTAAAGPR